jgi:NAD(P)-dependent dehydrogenase (short-subunit alcohol dehydrogenase family)
MGAEFDEFPESGWDKVMDLNVKTPFFLTQALHSALKTNAAPARPSKVINIASIDGVSVNPQETYSYAASKSGLIHLTKRMALRLIRDNIAVSAIAPGAFPSEMNREARDHNTDCGGECACATCHVYVDPRWLEKVGPQGSQEAALLDFAALAQPNSRLACQIKMDDQLDGLVVRLPEAQH